MERLSGVRLGRAASDVIVDLLFASSGIEDEVVANATRLTDLGSLIPAASAEDLDMARQAVRLIQERGFNREQDVAADLDQLIGDLGR